MRDGYVIRRASAADAERLAALGDAAHPYDGIAPWVLDLLEDHPLLAHEHVLVAEDPASGDVASTLLVIPQTWLLDGVPVLVGQVELVATDPAHRGRGLVGRLLREVDRWADAAGAALLVIEGIPHYYRRFGYEYALANGGGLLLPPPPEPGAPATRPARAEDAEQLAAVDAAAAGRWRLFVPRTAALWRYELAGRRPGSLVQRDVRVVEDGGRVAGYVVASGARADRPVDVVAAELADPAAWARLGPALLSAVAAPARGLALRLDARHPLLALAAGRGTAQRPGAWYVRTPDPLRLLQAALPGIARRLDEAGIFADGELGLDLYGRGACISFREGQPPGVEPQGRLGPHDAGGAAVRLPVGALLQLALGYRSLAQVEDQWPDVLVLDERVRPLLQAAFPPAASAVWAVG